MADNYERYDQEGNGGGFMMGLLTGTVLGAGLGMLLAPKAGAEIRGVIGEQARNLGNMASEQYRRASDVAPELYKKATDSATGWAEKGREFVDRARESVNRGAEETRGFASDSSASGSPYGGPSSGNSSSGGDFGRS